MEVGVKDMSDVFRSNLMGRERRDDRRLVLGQARIEDGDVIAATGQDTAGAQSTTLRQYCDTPC
jgi:hypothetical protein